MVSENDSIKSVRLLIEGRVQGVGFRYFAKQLANQYHIFGWIRNRDDGRVEVAAEGPDDQLKLFLHRISKGVFPAKVRDVYVQESEPQFYSSFDLRATV